MMFSLNARTFLPSSSSVAFLAAKHFKSSLLPSFKLNSYSSSRSISAIKMSAHTIEHVVLFKVKDDTEPPKIESMIKGLCGLVSLDQVLHLTVGPVLHNRSQSLNFTHMLHSRYRSKDDLNAYSAHPDHVNVVKSSVLPICEDIMAVDWVAENLQGDIAPPPGSAYRVSFLKLKERLGDEVKNEILEVVGEMKDKFGEISQLTRGENFSPARAKGFSIASLAVFPGIGELEAVSANEEVVNSQKAKVKEHLDGVVVIDYVVPSP